jgi:hypothetical protein
VSLRLGTRTEEKKGDIEGRKETLVVLQCMALAKDEQNDPLRVPGQES